MKNMKQVLLGLVIGIAFMSVGDLSAASVAKNIEVFYNNIRIFIDGDEVKPEQEPFVYEGTTYVPLRFVSSALGKEVKWNAQDVAVYIGKQPEGDFVWLENMKTHTSATSGISNWEKVTSFRSNMDKTYIHGLYGGHSGTDTNQIKNTYLLNGSYSKFEAVIDVGFGFNSVKLSENLGELIISIDGVRVYGSGPIRSDITEPIKVEIDLTNANQIEIFGTTRSSTSRYDGRQIGILDAKFIY